MAKTLDSTDLIAKFARVDYKKSIYDALAERVKWICEANLPKDIQAIVTFRSKKRHSLEEKLRNMNASRARPFQSCEEIESSISDLAGVRIALYVPQQKEDVIKGINTWFPGAQWKKKPGKFKDAFQCRSCGEKLEETECASCREKKGAEGSNVDSPNRPESDEAYSPVFAGYVADHARVKLTQKQVEHPKLLEDWNKDHVIEIQVVSVLLHAWAEVEHDIVYKSIKAKAGNEERKILDSLNGFIRASELLLDQLHSIHTNRIESAKKEFGHKFALASFLQEFIGGVLSDAERNNLELKMLFGLLKVLQKNSPEQLGPILESLGFAENPRLTDLSALGDKYSKLVATANPFVLARHMRIPYYIMHGILAGLSEQDECCARARAGGGATPNTDEDRAYRCRVLLSSFVWMGQLCLGGSIDNMVEDYAGNLADPRAVDAFNWPFESPARFNILNGGKADKLDEDDMDILWDWFEEQERLEKHSFTAFVFRIARLGVIASFPDDLTSLRKGPPPTTSASNSRC